MYTFFWLSVREFNYAYLFNSLNERKHSSLWYDNNVDKSCLDFKGRAWKVVVLVIEVLEEVVKEGI